MKHKIHGPAGGTSWTGNGVKRILTNEKHIGDLLLQKNYTIDFLTKKQKANEGELPQYYVEDDHEAIVSHEVFDKVQKLIEARKDGRSAYNTSKMFEGRIICGDCGRTYSKRVWHANQAHESIAWQCSGKYSKSCGKANCRTPSYHEKDLKFLVRDCINERITSDKDFTGEIEKKRHTFDRIGGMKEELRELNSRIARLEESGGKKVEIKRLRKDARKLHDDITQIQGEQSAFEIACIEIEKRKAPLRAFNKEAFTRFVDHMVTHDNRSFTTVFRDGSEVNIALDPMRGKRKRKQ